MKFPLIALIFFLGIISCSITKYSSTKLDKQALDFSLKMVKHYFEEDCEAAYAMMADSMLTIDGDGVFAKAPLKERLCKGIKKAIRDKDKSYQDYLNTYNPSVLDSKALQEKFPKLNYPDYYTPLPNDRFFLGFEFKEGVSKDKNFIWDDLFFFVIRKTGNQWKMIGVEG